MATIEQNHTELSNAIQSMSDPSKFDVLAKRIVDEQPDHLLSLFWELHARCAKLHLSIGNTDQAEEDRLTAALLFAPMCTRSWSDGFRIVDDGKDTSGDVLGQWRSVPVHMFEHLWDLANSPKYPPPLRCLFLLGLWELRSLWKASPASRIPKPIEIARLAIDNHVEAANWIIASAVEPSVRGMLVVQHWQTASRIAVDIGNQQSILKDIGTLRAAQQQLLVEAPHWALSLVDIEATLAVVRGKRRIDLVTNARLEELLVLIEEIEHKLHQMGGMKHLDEEVLKARCKVEWSLGRGPDQKVLAQRRAEMFARHALETPSGIMASKDWKAAAAEYLKAGLREDAARAKAFARSAIQRADDEGEFQQVVAPIEVSDIDVEKMVGPFFYGANSPAIVLGRLATRLFVPSLERGRTANRRPRSIASQIAMTVPLVDDRSLNEIAPDTQEQELFEERRELLQEIVLISSVVISEVFRRLRQDFHLQEDDLIAFLSASPFIEPGDLPFLRTAATRYLRDDRISAMHVLVPRVEQVVRRILKAAGTDVTAFRDGSLRERPLGELLRASEVDGTMPGELIRLLQAVLSEEWGMNLRNRVAHGLITEAECSQPSLDRLMQMAIFLAGIRIGDKNEAPQDSPSAQPTEQS